MSKKKKRDNTKTPLKYPIKTSGDCEECKYQCDAGKRYISQVKNSGKGKGVICKNGN